MAQALIKPSVQLKRFQKSGKRNSIPIDDQSIILKDCLRVSQKAIVHQYSNCQSQRDIPESGDGSECGIKLVSIGTLSSSNDRTSWKTLPKKRTVKSTTAKRVLNITTTKRLFGNLNYIRHPSPNENRDEKCLSFETIGGREPSRSQMPIPQTSTRTQSITNSSSSGPSLRRRPQNGHHCNVANITPNRKNSFTVRGSEIKCFTEKDGRDGRSRLLRKREALKEQASKFSHSEVSCDKAETLLVGNKTCFHPPSFASSNGTSLIKRTSGRMSKFKWKPASPSCSKADVIDDEGQRRSKTSTGHYPKGDFNIFIRCTKSARSFRRPDHQSKHMSSGNTHVLLEADCRNMSQRLEESLYSDNLPKFRESLSSFVKEDRKKIVDYKETSGSANVLFRACTLNKISFVEFMLAECQPDLELTGPFIVQDEDSEHMVTPLWHAAATGQLDLLRLLKESGGHIDTCSDTGSTAVTAACYMSQVDVVKYLVSNKVNVHLVNVRGLSCLMNAVHSVELVRLLVLNGVEINRVDLHGNSAMHYAAKEGQLSVIRILNELGGNPLQVNNEGFSVIQLAAKYRRQEIMELLIQTSSKLKVEDIINVYELFGSMAIMLDNDVQSGYSYFYKAITLRYMNKSNFIGKSRNRSSELGKLENTKEFDTISGLLQAMEKPGDLTIQALLVYERQRGCMQDDFIFLLLYCGATFADKMHFQRAANLWSLSYCLNFRKYVNGVFSCAEPFNQQLIKSVHSVVKLLCQWKREESLSFNACRAAAVDDNDDDESFQIPERTIREIFLLLCDHISFANRFLKEACPIDRNKHKQSFILLTKSLLCVLHIYTDSYCVYERQEEVWQSLKPLANVPFVGTSGQTLLHMSVLLETTELLGADCFNNLFTWPSLAVVDILLLLGADPKSRDETGSTPVHLVTIAHNQGIPSATAIMKSLLTKRGHADQENALGQTAVDLLPSGKLKQYVLKYVSLQCLAAQVIIKNNIPYIDEIPSSLYAFVELHRKVSAS